MVSRRFQESDGQILDHLHHSYDTNSVQGSSSIQNVVGIIEATGYKAGLDYLDMNVRNLLHYDPACSRIPFLLTRGSILAEIPTIAFVGFYEGPFWGVMEMQTHVIARTWAEHSVAPGYLPGRDLYQNHVTKYLRHALVNESSLQVPQFWMSDYVGLIEEFAREAGVERDDSVFRSQAGPTFPSRYRSKNTDPKAAIVVEEVREAIIASSTNARFVAAAVFRAMQGVWTLHRTVESHNAASPGGILSGTAHFHPRTPTDPLYSAEYLYVEEGTFKMDNGYSFSATRRYIYRYNETLDKITAWFAGEDGESVATLFNTWDFQVPTDADHGWAAKGHHWCDPDTYRNNCEFRFRGASLQKFGITYEVEGPRKEYRHESWYERPATKDD